MENDLGGGGGPAPWEPRFRDIDVIPADLSHFARLVADDREALRVAWERARDELAAEPSPNFAGGRGGGDGMYEGGEFFRGYFLTLGAQLQLMSDALAGLDTLHQAATRIHADYVTTDDGNAGSLDTAFGAYELSTVQTVFDGSLSPAEAPEGPESPDGAEGTEGTVADG